MFVIYFSCWNIFPVTAGYYGKKVKIVPTAFLA